MPKLLLYMAILSLALSCSGSDPAGALQGGGSPSGESSEEVVSNDQSGSSPASGQESGISNPSTFSSTSQSSSANSSTSSSNNENDPEEEIRESMEDEQLEDQMSEASKILDSQQNFEFTPKWHGPFDVTPLSRNRIHFKHLEQTHLLLVSQGKAEGVDWSHPRFNLINFDKDSLDSFDVDIKHKLVNVIQLENLIFLGLTVDPEKIIKVDFENKSWSYLEGDDFTLHLEKLKDGARRFNEYREFGRDNFQRFHKLDYKVFVDGVSATLEDPKTIVWYRKKTTDVWKKIEVDTFYKYKKIRRIVEDDESFKIFYPYSFIDDFKDPLIKNIGFHSLGFQRLLDREFFLLSNGRIFERDKTLAINSWLHRLFKNQETLNPGLFYKPSMKLRRVKTSLLENKFLQAGFNPEQKKIIFNTVDTNALENFMGSIDYERVISFKAFENGYFLIAKKDGKTYLVHLNHVFTEIKSIILENRLRSARNLEVFENKIYLVWRRGIASFDMGLNLLWQNKWFGKSGFDIHQMPNKSILAIANDHVTLINPENGEHKYLRSLEKLDFKMVKESIFMNEKLFLNINRPKLYEINIPYHEIAL